jgi:hypothetical protein
MIGSAEEVFYEEEEVKEVKEVNEKFLRLDGERKGNKPVDQDSTKNIGDLEQPAAGSVCVAKCHHATSVQNGHSRFAKGHIVPVRRASF